MPKRKRRPRMAPGHALAPELSLRPAHRQGARRATAVTRGAGATPAAAATLRPLLGRRHRGPPPAGASPRGTRSPAPCSRRIFRGRGEAPARALCRAGPLRPMSLWSLSEAGAWPTARCGTPRPAPRRCTRTPGADTLRRAGPLDSNEQVRLGLFTEAGNTAGYWRGTGEALPTRSERSSVAAVRPGARQGRRREAGAQRGRTAGGAPTPRSTSTPARRSGPSRSPAASSSAAPAIGASRSTSPRVTCATTSTRAFPTMSGRRRPRSTRSARPSSGDSATGGHSPSSSDTRCPAPAAPTRAGAPTSP